MWTDSSNFHQDRENGSKSKRMEKTEVRNPERAWTGEDFYYSKDGD